MTKGKRTADIFSGLTGRLETAPPPATPAGEGVSDPAANRLSNRVNTLELLSSGQLRQVQHLRVDPARCRMWVHHNRSYRDLSEANCRDLLDSLIAEGGQRFPAIVRKVVDDPAHDWEVICGARRHWSVSWLRGHDYPDMMFLIEPRTLTDEEAFRLADVENRARTDLSDWERARDYAKALDLFYAGNQARMAKRLEVSPSWLSRYLTLARMPDWLLAAFDSPHSLGFRHGQDLATALNNPARRRELEAAAGALAADQAALASTGKPPLDASTVVKRLLRGRPIRPAAEAATAVTAPDGKRLAQVSGSGARVTVSFTAAGLADLDLVWGQLRSLLAARARKPR